MPSSLSLLAYAGDGKRVKMLKGVAPLRNPQRPNRVSAVEPTDRVELKAR